MSDMQDQFLTRETLLSRAKNQDDATAWEDFVNYYKDFIFIVIRHMNIPYADCEDLIQETLLKIWKNLQKFDVDNDRAKFRTWLSTVIRNTVLNYIDKKNRNYKKQELVREEQEVRPDLFNQSNGSQLDEFIEKEWQVYVTNLAMKKIEPLFSPQAIEAFKRSLDGESTESIAEILNIKPNSVYKLKNRVKGRLILEIKALKRELEPPS